ncbi:MAG: hypothetical protein ABEN55_02505 [Bradymonadaceae bacterium]
MDIIRPEVEGRFAFLTFRHRPISQWKADPGEIQDIRVQEGRLEIDVELQRSEVEQHPRYDAQKDGVMVTIQGRNPFLEEWALMKAQNSTCITMGLKAHD